MKNKSPSHAGKLICILLTALFVQELRGQLAPVGSWTDRLSYNTTVSLASGNSEIYASTGASILVYNKEFSELRKLSKVNGLSETGISSIAWSPESNCLIIAFKSTNLDLLFRDNIYTIPDIKNKYIPLKKRINKIRTSGKYAYLAAGFGIVVVDLARKEIRDTWHPGPGQELCEVFDIAFSDDKIYAATEAGLWVADITNQGLSWSGNWTQYTGLPDPGSLCNIVLFAGSVIYCNVPGNTGDVLYSVHGPGEVFSAFPGEHLTSIENSPDGFTVSSPGSVYSYGNNGTLLRKIDSFGLNDTYISQSIISGNDLWIADRNNGLVRGKDLKDFSLLTLPGPGTNKVSSITAGDGTLMICAGGTDNSWKGLERKFQVSLFSNNTFTNLLSPEASDAMRICTDSQNSAHFYVSSWGDGIFEYNGTNLIKHYDESNSPLEAGPSPGDGIRICGLAMDSGRNLWVAESGKEGRVKILKPDGNWIVNLFTTGVPLLGDIISASSGQKWILLPESSGVLVIDDNGTPGIFTDDISKRLFIRDEDGTRIERALSVAEDNDGNIWIGTDQGPVIYRTNTSVFSEDVRGYRIKVPRNDGSGLADYMLGTETITSVSVDGANRKWLGTKSSGVYLLSSDGSEMIRNYTEKNSALLSDSIASLALDNLTGEIWIGTSKGTVSVRELAIKGSENYSRVYAFPNPVREDYMGKLTITGLIKDTSVKITDISGNLVFETRSEGGQAEWDLATYSGNRVKTGVYLIFCASPDGSSSCMTKVLVVGN
jgi:hypothetical protein